MSPRLYTDANPNTIAYVLDGGGSGYLTLALAVSSMKLYRALFYQVLRL